MNRRHARRTSEPAGKSETRGGLPADKRNPMTPAEKIADDTWHKLKEVRNLSVRLGGETLTDLPILDLKRRGAGRGIWVHQTPGWQEKIFGTDLLVVVRAGTTSARLYAVLSKKLYDSGHYEPSRKTTMCSWIFWRSSYAVVKPCPITRFTIFSRTENSSPTRAATGIAAGIATSRNSVARWCPVGL